VQAAIVLYPDVMSYAQAPTLNVVTVWVPLHPGWAKPVMVTTSEAAAAHETANTSPNAIIDKIIPFG
jgi:hypothetical protein